MNKKSEQIIHKLSIIFHYIIHFTGGFLKWGYPQSSSILDWDFLLIINHPASLGNTQIVVLYHVKPYYIIYFTVILGTPLTTAVHPDDHLLPCHGRLKVILAKVIWTECISTFSSCQAELINVSIVYGYTHVVITATK